MKGFTLLEVMISVAILAISLLALFNLQSTSMMGASRAQRIETATSLARMKMVEVLVDFEAGMSKGEFPDEKENSGTFEEENYPDFSWELKIKKVEIPAPPSSDESGTVMTQIFKMVTDQLTEKTREIKLTVFWAEFDEKEEGIALTTHVVQM